MDSFKEITFTESFNYTTKRTDWLLILVQKGSGQYRMRAHISNYKKQDCFLISGMEQISFVSGNNIASHLLLISFTHDSLMMDSTHTASIQLLDDYLNSSTAYTYFSLQEEHYTLFLHYAEICLALQKDSLSYSKLIFRHTFHALLLFTARTYFSMHPEKRQGSKEQSNRSNIVENVKHFINQNYSENLSLTMIADFVFTNPSYLSRIFKEETGVSLSQYLNQIRIYHAKQLLADTEELVVDIALNCGYNYIPHFNRVFKELTGIPPLAYRKQFRQKRF